ALQDTASESRTGRGRGIRTPHILLPKQARYQTALFPACLATDVEGLWAPPSECADHTGRGERGQLARGTFSGGLLPPAATAKFHPIRTPAAAPQDPRARRYRRVCPDRRTQGPSPAPGQG